MLRFSRYPGVVITLAAVAALATVTACDSSRPKPPSPDRTGGSGGNAGGRGGSGGSATVGGAGGGQGTGGAGGSVDAPPLGACPTGQHACNGLCLDDSSPMSCGASCDPCPVVMGGTATCTGGKCGAMCPAMTRECKGICIPAGSPCDDTCPTGQNLCKGACVDAKSLTACGTSCTECPTSPNGAATCDGDKCDLACNAGYHRCGDACVSSADVMNCGSSCTACAAPMGGTATCDGTRCGGACPSGTTLCATSNACLPPGMPCGGACPAGRHLCNGTCLPDTEVNSCGASCTPCAVPANANATCENGACGFTCRANYHKCGEGAAASCKPNSSVESCGATACTPCPAPANATATCTNGACGWRCNDGFHKCGDGAEASCKPNNSELSCGTMCTPCTAPANGMPACTNGRCDFTCRVGRKCGNACIADTQPCNGNQCGPSFRFCGGTCVHDSTLTAEICDGKDNDCDGRIDEDVAPQSCGHACGQGQRTCRAGGRGEWDESRCPPVPGPSNKAACGTTTRCEVCTDPQNGVAFCEGGACKFRCTGANTWACEANGTKRCIPLGDPCNGSCPQNYKPCGNRCIPMADCCATGGTRCCEDHAGCGMCEKCVNKVCVPQVNEDVKRECPGENEQLDCRTGLCEGAGKCASRPNTWKCGEPMCATNGNLIPARFCNGAGTCSPAGGGAACSDKKVCLVNACVACTSDDQCGTGKYCATGNPRTCETKKALNGTCAESNECAMGACLCPPATGGGPAPTCPPTTKRCLLPPGGA
jgi:hypothetical protein